MRKPRPARIEQVRPGSPAARAGLKAGEKLVRVNGRAPRDYIHYRYLAAEAEASLTVEDPAGGRRRVQVRKAEDEDLGLRFSEDVFDGVITCRNRCAFCFISQLPKGLRPALYLRDDDYRLSFLHGNFITLTNVTRADRARIAGLHLSPLYVSVHATEPEVRAKLFGRSVGDVRPDLRWLIARGVEFHTQIVVCPGVNDGSHLEATVRDLAALHPGVRSIGVVPVGLTRHRRGLTALRPVGPRLARGILGRVDGWQREFLRQLGARLVFAADELYLGAGIAPPPAGDYEGYPQLANGIGGVRLFLDDLKRLRPLRLSRGLRATLVTGEGAAGLVGMLAEKLERGGRVQARVCVVRNRLFGRRVTTAGLLAGEDIARALQESEVGDVVIVPGAAVREGEGFVDGMTPADLSRAVGAAVVAALSPREAAAALRRIGRGRSRP